MNCMEQNALMQRVYETGFQIDDILLYLDTHPGDRSALAYYQNAREANRQAVAAYEKAYGPLMVTQVEGNVWNWIDSPWPWEGGMR